MEKFEFSPAGVAALCQQLYLLDDQALAAEAITLKIDVQAWTIRHFDLDAVQLSYLEELPTAVKLFLADQGSFALGNRLPITLSKPPISGLRASKLFKTSSTLASVVNPDHGYTATGELLLTISYG